MTREEHEKIMAAAVAIAREEGRTKGYDAGRDAGFAEKVEIWESELGEFIEDLIHKRDVLGLDIGDPLELIREAVGG